MRASTWEVGASGLEWALPSADFGPVEVQAVALL